MLHARALVVFLAACSSPSVTIAVTTGGETDALTRAPAVDSVLVQEVFPSGPPQRLAQVTLPQANIDLGNPSQGDTASIQVTGFAHGMPVVTGATPYVLLGALDGANLPLFVQRSGECARMPNAITDGRAAPLVTRTGQVLFVAGGTLAGGATPPVDGYSLLWLQQTGTLTPSAKVRSFVIQSLAQANSDGDIAYAYLVYDNSADIFELPDNAIFPPDDAGPGMLPWSDMSGGVTVVDASGVPYLIGGARLDGGPSNVVVQFPTDGTIPTANTASRQGAAVATTARGIVVYGGNTGPTDPGAELITSTPLSQKVGSYVSDRTQGLAAVAVDSHTVLVTASPRDPARRMRLLDLDCAACTSLSPWGPANTPLLSPESLFAMGSGAFLLVGDDPSGATRVFRIDSQSVTEMPLKIARQGARAIQTETGAVIIVGGGSSTLESCVL